MKTLLLFSSFFLILTASFCLGWCCNGICYDDTYNKLELYQHYYYHAKNLLDTLDNYYNWVDAFDPGSFYDAEQAIIHLNTENNY